jgi:hypothetical protein
VGGAGLGAAGVKGSRPGADEAVVGELTTGLAGAVTGTGGAAGFLLGAVVEQAAQHIAMAARQAGAQAPRVRVGCIYTPANT